jgi:hypothetical protein
VLKGLLRISIVAAMMAILGSCTQTATSELRASGSGVPAENSTTPSSQVTVTPTPPPKPKLADARIEGTYRMTYILVRDTFPGGPKTQRSTWRVKPHCKSGGACTVDIHSTNRWSAHVPDLNGHYKFVRNLGAQWSCSGFTSYNINGTGNYSFAPASMKLIHDEWIATRIHGVIVTKGNRGCGLNGPPTQQQAIQGNLQH